MTNTQIRSLLRASIAGETNVVRELIAGGVEVNARGRRGQSALHRAAYKGHVEIADLLIEAGASIEALDHDGASPLFWAAQNGHFAGVRLLLERGASPNARRRVGKGRYLSALSVSIARHHDGVAQILVDHGADLSTPYNGRDARQTAKEFGSDEIEQYIRNSLQNASAPRIP